MQGVDPTGASGDNRVINTVCAVIFSSHQSPPSPPLVQTGYASGAMSILKCFRLEKLVEDLLAVNGVHMLRNLLSLDATCHSYFDHLNLWFESFEHTEEDEHHEEVRHLLTSQ